MNASPIPPSKTILTQSDQSGPAYGGIGRLAYFGAIFGLAIVDTLVVDAAALVDSSGIVAAISRLMCLVAVFLVSGLRLKNTGLSPWWSLLLLIPILNLLVSLRCLAFQEGYQDVKRLDTRGRILFSAVVGSVIFIGIIAALALLP